MQIILFILPGILITVIITLGIFFLVSGKPSIIANHVIIEKAQETVFDFVADMRNELKWNPDAQFMEKLTEGPVGLGTRFRAKWQLSKKIDVIITHYQRPDHVMFVNGGPLEVILELDLSSSGNKTEMNTRFTVTPHGFLRSIFPIIKQKLKAQEQKNMVNLKNEKHR